MAPDLGSKRLQRQVEIQNRLGLFGLKVAVECVKAGVLFLVFQEQKKGENDLCTEKRGIFWGLPETEAVRTLPGVSSVTMKGEKWGLSAGRSFFGITNVEELGKAVAKDKEAGKKNFVSLLGEDGAIDRIEMLASQAKAHLGMFGEKGNVLSRTVDFVLERRY